MGLTVVTHTAGDRADLLARCVDSVERQLPPRAKHVIIQTNDFARARIKSLDYDDIIVWVDDDDVVVNDSINQCYTHLINSDCHLAFTNQAYVDIDGVDTGRPQRYSTPLTYSNLIEHPDVAHHLAMFKTDIISHAPRLSRKYQTGICWITKVEAALKGGAIHIPITGYNWTQHPGNMSKHTSVTEPMRRNMRAIQAVMRGWNNEINQAIPVANIDHTDRTPPISELTVRA